MTSRKFLSMKLLQVNTTEHIRPYNEESTNDTWVTLQPLLDVDKQSFDEDIDAVYEANAKEVQALFPLILFYTSILTIGVIGNALVLLVYSFRYKRSPARVYILFLAGIDFSICLFGLPYHLIDMTNPYTYTNAIACKILTFIIVTLFHMSIFGLIVIAVDRYLKICKPLGKLQVAYFGKKRACGAAFLASLLLSWPNIVLYGRSEMEISVLGNITGYSCFFETQYYDTHYLFIYVMSALCVCLGSTVFLIVAYSLICHQICIRYKQTGNHRVSNDDIEYTEEISMKYLENETTRTTTMTNCTTSRESINPLHGNSLQGLARSSVVTSGHGIIQNLDSHLIECNPNGSLTFIGDLNNLRKDMTSESFDRTDETSELLSKSKPELSTANKVHASERHSSKRIRSCENITSLGATKVNSLLAKETGSANAIFHTHCDDSCVKLLHDHKIHTLISEDLLRHGRDLSRNNRNNENCKRLSLQVPNTYQAIKKELSLRRTSDSTGTKLRRDTRRLKPHSSVIMSGALNDGTSSDAEGLRIHHTSHQSIASLQGPVKANKTVTRQHSKITKIMLTITIIFVLSYAPTLVVQIWSIIVPEFWDILTEGQTVLCEFFLRFYLVNNICNPFIYGFWDKRFKREIVYTFRKLKTSIRNKLSFGCCVSSKT